MSEANEKQFILDVNNTITKKDEEVEVSEEVYNTYRRTGWNIKNNDASFFAHEIQMSALIGGNNSAHENFKEFIDTKNTPDNEILKKMINEDLYNALSKLNISDQELIYALYFDGMTEREYAEKKGVYHNAIHKRKVRILEKIKKYLIFKD